MIDDVPAAVKFYTTHLGFVLDQDASPAFASVTRDGVRLLLSGKTSYGRRAMPDGRAPVPGGWNRIHIQVDDLKAQVKRLRAADLKFRNEIIIGPGGSQILSCRLFTFCPCTRQLLHSIGAKASRLAES